MLQQIGLGGTMIALPIYLQIVLEYSAMGVGLSIAPLSLSMFAVALAARKTAGKRRPASLIRAGFALFTIGMVVVEPIVPRAASGWYLVVPLMIAGSGLGLMVSQLNNYTLAPILEERVSEAAGVNSAGGSFGLSFGLAFAVAVDTPAPSCWRRCRLVSPAWPGRAPCCPAPSSSRSPRSWSMTPRWSVTPSSKAARRPAAEDTGRDHQDQHPGPAPRHSGGTAHSHRGPGRTAHLVPDDAPARSPAIGLRRTGGLGLTTVGSSGQCTCSRASTGSARHQRRRSYPISNPGQQAPPGSGSLGACR